MSTLLEQLANGLVLGGTIALIAIGYTMVYGIIQLINFAHGEVFMVGAYGALLAFMWWLPSGAKDDWYITLPILLVIAILVSVVVAVLMERLAYRPLRNAPRLAPLITALGVSVFLQEFVRVFYVCPSPTGEKVACATSAVPFPEAFVKGGLHVPIGQGFTIPWSGILIIVVSLGLAAVLQAYVARSRMGRAMRATSADPDTARLMGVNPDRTIVITFAIGGALAGIAGVLFGVKYTNVNIDMGFLNGIFAFTAAVLGGIGSIKGAVVGGFAIGLIKTLAGQYLPGGTGYDLVWIFILLIVVLVFRPQGFFGETERVRA
ncbi:branched-chain amino acid ABC transporter permease [Actinophytocola sp.]|uniref:branched-chain amino acid ABC transporter permease n=1 Tax=Actinophytocola sp. TaxID=1872138 RepID=UPI002D80751A|nr:branched-chain amino acid ABC transporter permease [Actinophytocola sp.]HET9140557.1 branched-chain amino acid ABC transporter permease [Actinophytocola sp.]